MKIKDLVNKLSKYDENTEVFVNDEEGHDRIDLNVDVIKDKFLLDGRLQTVIRLIGKDDFKRTFIF